MEPRFISERRNRNASLAEIKTPTTMELMQKAEGLT